MAGAVARARDRFGDAVEDKGLSLTLHVRTRPDLGPAVRAWAAAEQAATGLELRPAKASVELHPPVRVDKGSVVTGTVKSVDGKGAVINLGSDIEGYLRASELSRDRVEDMRQHLKEGDSVTAMIINVDRKNRSINLSIKAKDNADESAAMQRMTAENAGASTGTTNLGALLKAKLDNKANG